MAEIFQKRDKNIKHVELSIAAHRMRFLGIAARFEPTIAGVQHRSVWPGLMCVCVCVCLFVCLCVCGYVRWCFQESCSEHSPVMSLL